MNKTLQVIDNYLVEEEDLRKYKKGIEETIKEQERIIKEVDISQAESELEEITLDAEYFLSRLNAVYEEISNKKVSRTNLKKEFGKKAWSEYKQFCKEIGVKRQAKISYRLNIGNKTINYSQGKLITTGIGSAVLTSSMILLTQAIGAGKETIESIKEIYASSGPAIGVGTALIPLTEQSTKIEDHAKDIEKKIKNYNNKFSEMYNQ